MRTLKFRIWDREKKTFNFFDLYKDSFNIDIYKDPIIHQYTGFCDDNGKDIYENDYIEISNLFFGIVRFENGKFIVESINHKKIKLSILQKADLEALLNHFKDEAYIKKIVSGNIFQTKVEVENNFHPDDVHIVNKYQYNKSK